MFKSKTVLIVGAGASKEVGLPTGAELIHKIVDTLNMDRDEMDWATLTEEYKDVERAIERKAAKERVDPEVYFNAARQICAGMPLTNSIDGYIDMHRGNEAVQFCGKLAIVRSILGAERSSLLHFHPEHREGMDFYRLAGAWHMGFFKKLHEGVPLEELDRIFENVAIITFNYDRCIEHFLTEAIRTIYHVDRARAEAVVRKLRIHHPYGKVGDLPWTVGIAGTSFGGDERGFPLEQLAEEIRTYTEQVADQEELETIRRLITDAETLVFLGFAFADQNMALLKLENPGDPKRIFATVHGISDADQKIVRGQMRQFYRREAHHFIEPQTGYVNFASCYCGDLFNLYGRSIGA